MKFSLLFIYNIINKINIAAINQITLILFNIANCVFLRIIFKWCEMRCAMTGVGLTVTGVK